MAVDAPIVIPLVLFLSAEFSALSAELQQRFQSRLCHCLEIAENAFEAINQPDIALLDAIDDIELDALCIMNAFADEETNVSPYIVHSSWTFECERQAMTAHVEADARDFFRLPGLPLSASYSDVRKWLKRWARILHAVLGRFSGSRSFTEAIVQLIVIDALLASYLTFSATVRLNSRIGGQVGAKDGGDVSSGAAEPLVTINFVESRLLGIEIDDSGREISLSIINVTGNKIVLELHGVERFIAHEIRQQNIIERITHWKRGGQFAGLREAAYFLAGMAESDCKSGLDVVSSMVNRVMQGEFEMMEITAIFGGQIIASFSSLTVRSVN